MKPKPLKLHVLAIDNENGISCSVYSTKEGATQALYDYVKENWTGGILARLGPLPKVSAPQDVDETIEAYFTADGQDDRAEIEAVTLED